MPLQSCLKRVSDMRSFGFGRNTGRKHLPAIAPPDYTNSNRVWYRQCAYGGGFCDGFNCPAYTSGDRGGYCSCNALSDAVDDLTDQIDYLREVVEQMTKYTIGGE